jgi:anti-repressor protein
MPKLHMRIHKGERYVTAVSVQVLLAVEAQKMSEVLAKHPHWRTRMDTMLLLHHSALMPLTLKLMTHVPSARFGVAHWLKDGAVHRILNYKIEGEVVPAVRPQELRVLVAEPQGPMPLISQRVVGGVQINAVNARDLHGALGCGADFSTWMKERIDQYGFVAGRDFEVYHQTVVNHRGGRPAKEYALSLDMAKELAMVERSQKGKEVRTYFIECERKLHGQTGLPQSGLLSTISNQIQTLFNKVTDYFTQNDKRVERLERQIELLSQAKPSTRSLRQTGTYITFNAAARQLGVPVRAAQIPTRSLIGWLEQNDWIVRDGKRWMPRPQFVREGMLVLKPTCRLTPKGLDCLMREFA